MKKVPVLDMSVKEKEDQSPGRKGEEQDKNGFPFRVLAESRPYSAQGQEGHDNLPQRGSTGLSCNMEFQYKKTEKRDKEKKKRVLSKRGQNDIIHIVIILLSGTSIKLKLTFPGDDLSSGYG
jgi:hypothetical protein